jgi:hypothetical protein
MFHPRHSGCGPSDANPERMRLPVTCRQGSLTPKRTSQVKVVATGSLTKGESCLGAPAKSPRWNLLLPAAGVRPVKSVGAEMRILVGIALIALSVGPAAAQLYGSNNTGLYGNRVQPVQPLRPAAHHFERNLRAGALSDEPKQHAIGQLRDPWQHQSAHRGRGNAHTALLTFEL